MLRSVVMKQVSDLLVKHRLLYERLEPIALTSLGSRKKLECYLGVDDTKHYNVIFVNPGKTRVLQKDFEQIQELVTRLETLKGHRILKRILFSNAPVCSKAIARYKKEGWKVWHVSV